MNRVGGILCCVLLGPATVSGGEATNVLVWAMKTLAERSQVDTADPDRALIASRTRLQEEFDRWLQDPHAYRAKALLECRAFPEGRIYPFAIPALAYANLALAGPEQREHSASQMRKLIDLLISTVTEDVGPPGDDLTGLEDCRRQGTRLATLNLTLASYALLSPDGRYDRLHAHVSELLRRALVESGGAAIASYPEYTWYFDTLMALVSLELYDRAQGSAETRPLLERHLAWRKRQATDDATGLPIAYPGGLPRGCDLSMQVCLLQYVDPQAAQGLYADYIEHHWADLGFIAGFREWPKSKGLLMTGDIDSGPLMLGIGPTATGVGIGAARAVGDTGRLNKLARQLQLLPELMKLLEQGGQQLFGGQISINRQYVTGFLYGDAVVFYAVTWVPYPRPDAGSSGKTPRPVRTGVDARGPVIERR